MENKKNTKKNRGVKKTKYDKNNLSNLFGAEESLLNSTYLFGDMYEINEKMQKMQEKQEKLKQKKKKRELNRVLS